MKVLFCLSLVLSLSSSVIAREMSADLYRALNPSVVNNERKIARQIIVQFHDRSMRTQLEYYIADNDHSIASKSIAAEVIVQLAEAEEGNLGLLNLNKRAPRTIVNHALQHIIQRLAKTNFQQLPRDFKLLSLNDKKNLVNQMLNAARGSNNALVARAIGSLLNLSDAILVVSSYRGDDSSKKAAGLALARIAEIENGEFGLARLANMSDLKEEYRAATMDRIREILSGMSAQFTKFRDLESEDKTRLVHKLLENTKQGERVEMSGLLVHLDKDKDLEAILRSYTSSVNGIEAAAKTIVRLYVDGRTENLIDNSLVKLSQDSSPFVRREAAERIKKRISKSAELSPVYRLLDPTTKRKLLKSLLDSIASQDRELLTPTIQKLFHESTPSGVAASKD